MPAHGRATLRATTIGQAVVIHRIGVLDPAVDELVTAAAPDADRVLVVLDVPPASSAVVWEEVATLLPRPRRGLRVVLLGRTSESIGLAGSWLSDRLDRPIVVADGEVVPDAGGGLFIDPASGAGWVQFRGALPAAREARRFPTPVWEVPPLVDVAPVSATVVAEPIPAGVWIHQREERATVCPHRMRLQRMMPAQGAVAVLALGCPGEDLLALGDVVRFWRSVPRPVRDRLRPMRYGGLAVPPGVDWMQSLADLLGEEVTALAGMPLVRDGGLEVWTVRSDGATGWRSRACELGRVPRGVETEARSQLVAHQPVSLFGRQTRPGVYWHAPDAVVEIVAAGLWVRPAADPAHAEAMRRIEADPDRHLVVFEDRMPADGRRMRLLAEALCAQLDDATSRLSELRPTSDLL